ncbi:MAG: hypothetical protein AAFR33_07215 [Pseudomonadota bacterium]
MFRMPLLLAAAALMLGACATSTPYAPMDGTYGYAEQRIEDDRFRVMFHGNKSTSRETVETFLLYRAAELTVKSGYDHFLVVEQDTDVSRSYRSTGHEPSVYGYYHVGYRRFPYYAYGYPWSYDVTIRERQEFEAHAFIVLREGPKPEDELRAFDAREVMDNLGPRVRQSLVDAS